MTLLGEPIEEPGGEMDASDKRLCLSLFSALAACLHNGCHTSEPVKYISSPSLNMVLQRAQRAQVGW